MVSDKFYQKKKEEEVPSKLETQCKNFDQYSIHLDIVCQELGGRVFFLLNRQNPLSLTKLFVDSPLKLEESKFLYYQS